MPVYGIKFKQNGKTYYFISDKDYGINDKVIVETDKGIQLGIVAEKNIKTSLTDLNEIKDLATDKDYDQYLKNIKDAKNALIDTKTLVKKLDLNMNLIDANYSLDRKVLLFNFISDERVDFRKLVKELATRYHTRIELHQVGVRDKAKEIGGTGLCGRVLCCKNHLSNVGSVNINMVKNQNIALNPTKINGACGRLLCCFTYENEVYEENKKNLPEIGDKITLNDKEGKVIELDILNQRYKVKFSDNSIEEVSLHGSN